MSSSEKQDNSHELKAGIHEINTVTNEVAADLKKVAARLKPGLDSIALEECKAACERASDRLKELASDPKNLALGTGSIEGETNQEVAQKQAEATKAAASIAENSEQKAKDRAEASHVVGKSPKGEELDKAKANK